MAAPHDYCTTLRRMWSAGLYPELGDVGDHHPCMPASYVALVFVVLYGTLAGCYVCLAVAIRKFPDAAERLGSKKRFYMAGPVMVGVLFVALYIIYRYLMTPIFSPTVGLSYNDSLSMLPPAPPAFDANVMYDERIEGSYALYVGWVVAISLYAVSRCLLFVTQTRSSLKAAKASIEEAKAAKAKGEVLTRESKSKPSLLGMAAMRLLPVAPVAFMLLWSLWRLRMAPVYDQMNSPRWMPQYLLVFGVLGGAYVIAHLINQRVMPTILKEAEDDAANLGHTRLAAQARQLDASIIDCLRNGSIRLLSVAWLKADGSAYLKPGSRLPRRQDLPEGALLSPEAAVEAYERNAVYVVSHGWLTAGHPDPYGHRLRRLLDFLGTSAAAEADATGMFIDFASLHQKASKDKERTEAEAEQFKEALPLMGRLYGSAHTIVLQIREVPSEPAAHTAAAIEELGPYNALPYDDRGWPQLETGAATIAAAIAKESAEEGGKKHVKLFELTANGPIEKSPPPPSIQELEARIEGASFTGKGDKPAVIEMIRDFNTLLHAGASGTKVLARYSLVEPRPLDAPVGLLSA